MKFVPKDVTNGRMEDGYIDMVERDGYNHLGYFSPLSSSTPQYITGGNWEVTNGLAAFDKHTNTVYIHSLLISRTDTLQAPENPL
jgi:dipeptidyl aminopeptidase B